MVFSNNYFCNNSFYNKAQKKFFLNCFKNDVGQVVTWMVNELLQAHSEALGSFLK